MRQERPGFLAGQTFGSESAFLHPLPVPLTPLVGREHEVAELCTLLQRPSVRLLNLVGPGGVGKTRLGLVVAQAMQDTFEDGICFVPLAPLSDPAHLLLTIAQALNLQEVGVQSLKDHLCAALRDRHLLLLLDNFEHLLEAAPQLAVLLASCPLLRILVTSRAALRISGAQEFAVSPLAVPDLMHVSEPQALAQLAAVRLFVIRAQAVQSTFMLTAANAHVIAEICVRLDGLPLAIELAAARIKLLPPHALLMRLSQRLQVLTSNARDVPARQQTLRATLKWSYDLLDAQERRLFRWLSVFVCGWTLEAAEVVCQAVCEPGEGDSSFLDKIEALLDKSLLQQVGQQDEEPRLMMLETVREYAQECLRESGEQEASERAHALYYLWLVQEADLHLQSEQRLRWLVRLEQEMADIFAALGAAFKYSLYAELVQAINAFTRFLDMRGLYTQAEYYLKRAQQLTNSLHDSPGLYATSSHPGQSTLSSIGSQVTPTVSSSSSSPASLTAREREVLHLVALGLTDAQVAERLSISHRTVTTHLTSIYNKLSINSRVAATRFAIEHHLA